MVKRIIKSIIYSPWRMAIAYLAFGSNLGDRVSHLKSAQEQLSAFGDIEIVRSSAIYETEPFCYFEEDKNQPWYLNQIVEILTTHSPTALFLLSKEVESRMGGCHSSSSEVDGKRRYFPRIVDIDLLIYDDVVIKTSVVEVPHPRFPKRCYDLVPFAALAPHCMHPVFQKTVAQLLEECEDKCVIKPYEYHVV